MLKENDIDILYLLEKHGWSTCYIVVDHELYEMVPTHIFSNPIEDMLNAFISLLNGADEVSFKWFTEPGEYYWTIKRNMEQHHKIKVHIAGDKKPFLQDIEFETKIRLFCISLIYQMEKIRDLMTEKSFKENREEQFPFETFKEFKQIFNSTMSH